MHQPQLSTDHCRTSKTSAQHIEGKWFKSIRDFRYKKLTTIRINGLWIPRLQRTNDQCIMDILRTSQDTMRINRARIYLQATTLADITNAEGTKITEYAFGGRNSRTAEVPQQTNHEWPRQPRPGPKAWKAWREAFNESSAPMVEVGHFDNH